METDSLRAEGHRRLRLATAETLSALLLVALVVAFGRVHRARAAAPSVLWVDPAEASVVAVPPWADARWVGRVQQVLAGTSPMDAAHADLAPLCAALTALSFVERVERCELSSAGGLELELCLREPVACIRARDGFALVDGDGVVLEGAWPEAPRLGRVWLPVLGPLDDPLFAEARAGDWLVEPEHSDALDVALSLAEHLDEGQRAGLGRIVIDARTARRASVTEPGVRLELPGERLALFGRAPGMDEPGELEPASKWRALARALELFERDPDRGDWGLVDLRWDRPDIDLRSAPVLAALAREASHAPSRSARVPAARGEDRPHVR